MAIKVGINGFGRIGRCLVRLLADDPDIEVVLINDITSPQVLGHLLKYDSVHRTFKGNVAVGKEDITIDGKTIPVTAIKDPGELPLKKLGVDIVWECTGLFRTKEKAGLHLKAGAKKVIISAPATEPDATFVYGINHKEYDPDKHNIMSVASCTTNCLAPVAKVLLESFGVVRGLMTTIHAYTNDQRLLDLPHKDLRRARAAAVNMIPTSTGAAKAVGLVLPQLKGKLDGLAVRVPTTNVSMLDLVAQTEKSATVEDVVAALKSAEQGDLKGIMRCCDEPLVSIDFLGDLHSCIVDTASTYVSDKNLVKVMAWYDNEMGFSQRMIDFTKFIAGK